MPHFYNHFLLTFSCQYEYDPPFFPTWPRRVNLMFFQTEAKPQGWRAVAVFDDRTDRLIYLGRSSTQVRANLGEAYFEVLDDEERDHVKSISLQRWHGTPDSGRWMHQTNLNLPVKVKLARSA